VHGAELVVELRRHVSEGHVALAEDRGEHAPHHADVLRIEVVPRRRHRELIPHEQHHPEPDQQEHESRDHVLHADHLVIDRKHVFSPEGQRLVMAAAVSVFV